MKIPCTLSAVGLLLSALCAQAAQEPVAAGPAPAQISPAAPAASPPPGWEPAGSAPQEAGPPPSNAATAQPDNLAATGPTTTLPGAPAAGQPGVATTAVPQAPATDITAPLRDTAPVPAPAGDIPPPQSGASLQDYASSQVAPLSREQIEALGHSYDELKRGRAWQPVRAVPRISSLTVNLSPGASLPVLRTAPGQPGNITFTDSTGAPWKVAAPPFNANPKGFFVAWVPDSNLLTVQALRQYDTGGITVYLAGLSVPVVISMNSGEPDNPSATQIVDSRLDLRIPRRGPSAHALPSGESKIGLYDDDLQAFLDGTPPADARRLKLTGGVPDTDVWQRGDDLYVRTRSELRDEFERTLSSGDGTTLYRLPVTPYLTFSVDGKTQSLTLNLE